MSKISKRFALTDSRERSKQLKGIFGQLCLERRPVATQKCVRISAYMRLPLHKVITQPSLRGTSLGITFKTISAGSSAKTGAALFRG